MLSLIFLVSVFALAYPTTVLERLSDSNAKIEVNQISKGKYYSPSRVGADGKPLCVYGEFQVNKDRKEMRVQMGTTTYFLNETGCMKDCKATCEGTPGYVEFMSSLKAMTYVGKFGFKKPHDLMLRAYRGVLPLDDTYKNTSALVWIDGDGNIRAIDFLSWKNGFDRIWFSEFIADATAVTCQASAGVAVDCKQELFERYYDPDIDLSGVGTFIIKLATVPQLIKFWSTWYQDKTRKLLRIDIGNPKDFDTPKYQQSFYMNETGGYLLENPDKTKPNRSDCHWKKSDTYDAEIQAYSYKTIKWLGQANITELEACNVGETINLYVGWAPDVAYPVPGYQVILYLKEPANNYLGMEILNPDPNNWRRYGFSNATTDVPTKEQLQANSRCEGWKDWTKPPPSDSAPNGATFSFVTIMTLLAFLFFGKN